MAIFKTGDVKTGTVVPKEAVVVEPAKVVAVPKEPTPQEMSDLINTFTTKKE